MPFHCARIPKRLPRFAQFVSIRLAIVVTSLLLFGVGTWQLHERPVSVTKPPQKAAPVQQAVASRSNTDQADASTQDTSAAPTTSGTPKTSAGNTAAKSSKTLTISPSTVVMYKKPDGGNPTVKASATHGTDITISASDGKTIDLPWNPGLAGIFTSTGNDTATYRPSWSMRSDSTYAWSSGIRSYTFTANTSAGVRYTGSITVDVRPMPIFTAAATNAVVDLIGDQLDITFYNNGAPAEFNFDAVSAFMPTLEFTVGGISCTMSLANPDGTPNCNGDLDAALTPGAYNVTFVIENQFQRVVIPGSMYVS